MRLKVTVIGHPEPGGSKRWLGKGRPVIDDNPKVMPWRALVAAAAVAAMGDREPLTGPVGVAFTFFVRHPQGHFRTGKRAGELRASAPRRPTVRPDVTKLIRSVEDACTSILWRDDSQIVFQVGRKLYGTPERCEIELRELPL